MSSSTIVAQAVAQERQIPLEAECTVMVPCQLGLHLRVTAVVVTMARQFRSDIHFSVGRSRVDAKSILGMLGLGAVRGKPLILTARGSDADRAIRVLGDLFETPEVLCKEGKTLRGWGNGHSGRRAAATA